MRVTPLGCKILEGHDVADIPLVSENSEILEAEMTKKVDKVAGKGLSTNDYTTTEKTKLSGIEASANNYTHPTTHPASIITEAVNKRFMTDAERTKLAYIETFANYYDHPASHPASMITESTTRRFVTDAEKAKWESASSASGYVHPTTHPASIITEAVNKRFMTDAERTKLAYIETFANYYDHPESHPASMIVEAVNKRFMTDAERTKLASIETFANYYEHPASHSASMINETTDKRFVSGAMITHLINAINSPQIVTGSYAGNGALSRYLSLGFGAKFVVIICSQSCGMIMGPISWYANSVSTAESTVKFSNNSYLSSIGMYLAVPFNTNNISYDYIAFR